MLQSSSETQTPCSCRMSHCPSQSHSKPNELHLARFLENPAESHKPLLNPIAHHHANTRSSIFPVNCQPQKPTLYLGSQNDHLASIVPLKTSFSKFSIKLVFILGENQEFSATTETASMSSRPLQTVSIFPVVVRTETGLLHHWFSMRSHAK